MTCALERGGSMKPYVLFLMMLFLVACGDDHMSVYNGCSGTWARISDGRGNILNPKLKFGERMSIEYPRPAQNEYSSRVLNADGFRLDNNEPLGAVSYTFTLNGDVNITGPRENSWNITYFPGGCPTH